MAKKNNQGVRKALKAAGSTLSRKEAKQIKKSTGASLDKVYSQANKQGVGLEQSATKYYNNQNKAAYNKEAFLGQALGDLGISNLSKTQKAIQGADPGKNQAFGFNKSGQGFYDQISKTDKTLERLLSTGGTLGSTKEPVQDVGVEPTEPAVEDPYAIDFESFFSEMAAQQNAWAEDFATAMDTVLTDMEESMGGIMADIAGDAGAEAPEPTDIIRGEFETGAQDSPTSVPDVNGQGTDEVLDTTNDTGLAIGDATGATGLATPDDVTTSSGLAIGV
jgi:hypothetical protein